MATVEVRPTGSFSPVAVVWCRQVDNEAESPGYTTIPEEFPGRRETLETIRLVGNLTVNVADTHDYWDPDPAQTLSYYPNLFLYPAGNGRYTCIGRMFLSTEDRPRLGMKTLVLDTPQLVASGDFGGAVLQAWASMGGRPGGDSRRGEPDPAVYQAVGEGFLFHRGTTEPVVIVAAEQWESSIDAMTELVRMLPTSLTALGAFLAFPYFLPEGKVNLHEFAEQIPLALALMRVPEREAQGDRHAKRIQSWESAPVSLRDLTKPANPRAKDPLPLVLQYVRDHSDEKILEVSRRVDLVEATRLRAHMEDSDHQGGKDRRKEMWRIGTGMESAALLLARPRGRQIPMTGEAARRANQYLQAHPATDSIVVAPASRPLPSAPTSDPVAVAGANQVPPWLQRPPEVTLPAPGPVAVPVSVSDDPSTLPTGVVAPAPLPAPDARAPAPPPIAGISMASPALSAEAEHRLRTYVDQRFQEITALLPPPPDPKALETRLAAASLDSEARASANLDRRMREQAEAQSRALTQLQADLSARLNTLEGRPVLVPTAIPDEVARFQRETIDPKLADQYEKARLAIKGSADAVTAQLRSEIADATEEMRLRAAKSEEELRVALIAQMDLEIREAKEQGSTLREEIEGRVQAILKERLTELDARRTKEARESEQRLAILVDGRVKDLETRVISSLGAQRDALQRSSQDQIAQVERRLELADQARLASLTESQNTALAGLQVRLQSYFDQRMREDQEREREKYVELLARLKTEVDQGLAHTVDSAEFDRAVQTRTLRTVEALHLADQKTLDLKVADAAARLKSEQGSSIARLAQVETQLRDRETAIANVEKNVRTDLEELDRRLQVMADRMVPLVRNTWLKVEDLQKGGSLSEQAETRMKEFRREFSRELRRIEGEMLEQTTELRDRMEGAIAHQGRIWLNFVRQMADADDDEPRVMDPASRSLRRVAHAAANSPLPDPRVPPTRARPTFQPFDEVRRDDPVNPLDPRPDPGEVAERRRAQRTS
ncbi:MAG TPA: hypothetical protein VMF04_06170 [Thermoplasmata archaeon]|nr:hypothetical protein [Thermoplasmata archaeon]